MVRFAPAFAMAALPIATAFALARAEVATQPEPAASKTTFRAARSRRVSGNFQASGIRATMISPKAVEIT